MSYEPTTWVTGDIITATKLNNIESGVQSVSSSYTPTTWATGDIITATKLNNIEQGIANAGGGSSDFSTAEVTIANNTGSLVTFDSPLIEEDEGEFLVMNETIFNGERTLVIVLYKGRSASDINIDTTSDNITVTGNATYEDQRLVITGDCTITIS